MKAHSALILSLGDKALREVSKERTTKVVWDNLKEHYMRKFFQN